MTPAIKLAQKAKIDYRVHQYQHDASAESYGTEAAEKLGIQQEQVFKTLVVALDSGALVVAVIPVSAMLSMKQVAKACGGKKAAMAEQSQVERSTGYVLGGVSPLGQRKRLKTLIDSSAQSHGTIFVSAGKRGLEIEMAPADLASLLSATFAELQH